MVVCKLPETATMNSALLALREAMQTQGYAACLIPTADPHLSEYLCPHWQARVWLSGFTGSAGTLVVTADFAGLWADSRYWEQAEHELTGSGVTLMKVQTAASQEYLQWLANTLKPGERLAIDGDVLSSSAARALEALLGTGGAHIDYGVDLPGQVWADRPALPASRVYEHMAPWAGETRASKLARVRAAMRDAGASWHWLSTLDDIAWLTNLRGSDVEYNPVFLAHLLLSEDSATLFVDASRIDPALAAVLAADGVTLAPYDTAKAALASLSGGTLLLDPARVTHGFAAAPAPAVRKVETINPGTLMKSRKLPAEAAQIRRTMEADGAALCEFFAWLEEALKRGERVTELTVDERLTAARARQAGFVGLSFATIAGFNANGALPHYRATEAAHSEVKGDGLLLIDSGGQYLGGTTDITRVVAIGTPSAGQKRDCTRVLQGVIALSSAHFPAGTPSPALDALARAPMWRDGVDFGHGVGHGVGYFLNVHEGPQSISRAAITPDKAMLEGMLTSIEPGIYRPGQWGVRIENLVLNVAAGNAGFGDFLAFETMTLCPIDTRCLDLALLSADETAWLDAYHARVRERLSPQLAGDALAWLLAATEPLPAR
ncbi:aminopeptidase P family protein [Crenobacter intestini]|uniref:Aminopeptidase P family protein n=1 Tax=Crenobacter intestini TaxID=2563443 RepID=A0A4V4N8P5_9NEIS|nr:aminopeptidase P family protein [Crenobacter intestini]TIC85283.1 aminopeptidase P family protein [Crenobacter intestini]